MKAPILLKLRSHPAFITFAVMLAVFTDIFLYGLFVSVFPFALRARINIPEDSVQKWVSILLGLFGAGMVIGSPLFGWLADVLRNRRWTLLGGLVLLIATTTMLWVGRTAVIFAIGRILQGMSAAIVWSVGLALLVDTVGKQHVGEAMGWVSIGISAGMVSGPLLGGIIYDHAGYDAVFITAISLIAADVLLRLLIIESHEAKQYLADTHQQDGDTNPTRPLLGDDRPQNNEEPSKKAYKGTAFPVLLKNPRLICTLLCALVEGIVFTALEATLPLHVNELFDYGPTQASLVFAALMVPCLDAPIVGRVTTRFGSRNISLVGYTMFGLFTILLQIPSKNDVPNQAGFIVLLVFVGTAATFIVTPLMTELFMAVEAIELAEPGVFGPSGAFAQGYGLFNVAYAGGMLLGPLLAGHLRETYGWNVMTLVLGLMAFATCIPLWFLVGNEKVIERDGPDDDEAVATRES